MATFDENLAAIMFQDKLRREGKIKAIIDKTRGVMNYQGDELENATRETSNEE